MKKKKPIDNRTLIVGTWAYRVAMHGSAPEGTIPMISPGPEVLMTKKILTVTDPETGERRYEAVDIEPEAGP